MAETIDLDKKRAAERRLALLVLTGEQPEPPGPCLDAEQLACLVEGRLTDENVEACQTHLAACEHCYATWRQLDQEWQQRAKDTTRSGNLLKWFDRPRRLATTGSILALAASIAVFLSITMQTDRESLLRLPAQPSQEQKQTAPLAEPRIERPLSLEQTAPRSPAPQQLEKQREKKAQTRTDRFQVKEQEAVAKASAIEADRTTAARKTSAAVVPAAPPLQDATASADKLTEKKENISGMNAKEASPAPPQPAARTAREQSANTTGAEPLTLAKWQRIIREGCQGQPGPDFFAAITAQGKQLQVTQDALMGKEERRQVSRTLSLLASRHQQPATQQCQALLELLGPVARDDNKQ